MYAANVAAVREDRSALVWAGYAACVWGLVFAGISFYWGLGGGLGVDTLGGTLEQLARARDPAIIPAVWVTGFLKVAGALLALALVEPWGRRLPRPLLLLLGSGAAAVLTLYGGLLVAGGRWSRPAWSAPPTSTTGSRCCGTSTCGTCPSWSGASYSPSPRGGARGWPPGREPLQRGSRRALLAVRAAAAARGTPALAAGRPSAVVSGPSFRLVDSS